MEQYSSLVEENGLENREAANYRAWVQILPVPPLESFYSLFIL